MNLLEEVAVLDKMDRRIRNAAIIYHYSVNNITINFFQSTLRQGLGNN